MTTKFVVTTTVTPKDGTKPFEVLTIQTAANPADARAAAIAVVKEAPVAAQSEVKATDCKEKK